MSASRKKLTIVSQLKPWLSEGADEEKLKEMFGVESLEEEKEFSVSLEAMLWHLCTQLPVDESPLRKAAHQRWLTELAGALQSTADTDELPKMSESDKLKIRDYLDDPEKFAQLSVPFEFTAGEVRKAVPLPATNILNSFEFVSCIAEFFDGKPIEAKEEGAAVVEPEVLSN